MQVEELRWFVAAVREPNLTRLAGKLHVSQPALSRSLRRLERSVGGQLFDRVGRSLEPNPRGRALADRVERALEELDAGVLDLREGGDPERGEVRLAFLHTLGTWLVPELIGRYRSTHPDVRFRLRQSSARANLAGLIAGDHDLILTSPAPEDPVIGWTQLLREPLRLAVPSGHRLATRRRVRLRDVAEDPFIAVTEETGLRVLTDRLCERAGFSPRIAFEGQDVETLRGLVSAGLGVALLPARPGAPETPPLLAVADAGAERAIVLAWHLTRYLSPAAAAFAEYVRASARGLRAVRG
ncbi:MAG TPA: LysR family transcriptional regulator [Solirubrobacteraceae bacterium]|nr:LysR family transcriptional regulator [Solirubrobacteraceae bacterium]